MMTVDNVSRSELDLAGKRALVTGGSGGIGAAISARLARAGAHVFINYRHDGARAEQTQKAIEASGGSATPVQANLVDRHDIARMFRTVADAGHLDILVHCAALGSFKPTLNVRANQWDLTVSVNARAFLLCAQHASAAMDGRGGRIVALSSSGGARVIPNYGAIGISKAAVEAAVRYLAAELAPRGINVNAVAAGLVDTSSIRLHPQYAQLEAAALERTPARRLATPDDIARVVLFLCSPLADWVVGQTIVADGGFSLPA